jgi:hypothetical protein
MLFDELLPIIRHLINSIFNTAIYPDILKQAVVIPINKTGEVFNINDYRPVSILSTINKIIEKIIYNRMYSFIEKHNILYSHQFGFRRRCCSETAALEVVSLIRKSLDEGKIASAVFMDMRKAFDIVDRGILIKVLENYGFRGNILNLLESYLTNRTQVVRINNSISEALQIDTGVVQGSTLGSLLFILLINGICMLNGLNGKIFLFADDVVLINSHARNENAEQKITKDMEKVIKYIESIGMVMNMAKTKYMMFLSLNKSYNDSNEIAIKEKEVIQRVFSYKYLGLILDPYLKWNLHVENLEKKLCFTSAVLWKLKKFISQSVKKRIYTALFQSHINYMILLYGNASDSIIKPLQVIQNRALRNVFNIDRLENRVNMYTHLVENCLPLRALHYVSTAGYIYSNVNKCIHTNIVIERSHTRGRNARQLQPSISRNNYGKKNITSIGVNIFNNIPNDIRTLKTPQVFKWALKCHIRNEEFISNCFNNNYFQIINNNI